MSLPAFPFEYNFKTPDYAAVFNFRMEKLAQLRQERKNNPYIFHYMRAYYADNPVQFIMDWGVTFDPRNAAAGLPSAIPFILFPKQEEYLYWLLDHIQNGKPNLTEKSRDMGVSWLCVALACTLCLFRDGFVVGFGSRKQEYIDQLDAPKSIMFKAREFMDALPKEFKNGWTRKRDAPFMKIKFPKTKSIITGECGDNIGRGDRTSWYIVDEAAWLARPELIEASLSNTTNCRSDVSTPRGMGNPFAVKRHSGEIDVFSFHWRDDPRKDDRWYQQIVKWINDPVIVAQEIDMDYSASVEGVVIPAAWVRACVDSHIALGIKVTGRRTGALDIADRGRDLIAYCGGKGILIDYLEEWSGKEGDIYLSVERAFTIADIQQDEEVRYDADGMGAGARGDARMINEKRFAANLPALNFTPFWGSGEVVNPEAEVYPRGPKDPRDKISGRTNDDFFGNAKAQGWWELRKLAQNTYRAVIEKLEYNPDEILSISSAVPLHLKLVTELSQPTYKQNNVGKIIIDKQPEGARSPNLADAAMMKFSPIKKKARSPYAVG